MLDVISVIKNTRSLKFTGEFVLDVEKNIIQHINKVEYVVSVIKATLGKENE